MNRFLLALLTALPTAAVAKSDAPIKTDVAAYCALDAQGPICGLMKEIQATHTARRASMNVSFHCAADATGPICGHLRTRSKAAEKAVWFDGGKLMSRMSDMVRYVASGNSAPKMTAARQSSPAAQNPISDFEGVDVRRMAANLERPAPSTPMVWGADVIRAPETMAAAPRLVLRPLPELAPADLAFGPADREAMVGNMRPYLEAEALAEADVFQLIETSSIGSSVLDLPPPPLPAASESFRIKMPSALPKPHPIGDMPVQVRPFLMPNGATPAP